MYQDTIRNLELKYAAEKQEYTRSMEHNQVHLKTKTAELKKELKKFEHHISCLSCNTI